MFVANSFGLYHKYLFYHNVNTWGGKKYMWLTNICFDWKTIYLISDDNPSHPQPKCLTKRCFLWPHSINGMNALPLLLILGYNLTYMDKNTAKKTINLEVNKIPCISFFFLVNHTYCHVEVMTLPSFPACCIYFTLSRSSLISCHTALHILNIVPLSCSALVPQDGSGSFANLSGTPAW